MEVRGEPLLGAKEKILGKSFLGLEEEKKKDIWR